MRGPARGLIATVGVGLMAALASTVSPAPAYASHQGGELHSTAVAVAIEQSADPTLPRYATARLTLSDGSAVAGVEIVFRRHGHFLGDRQVVLGRALTDSGGVARIPLEPAGGYGEITAHFAGTPWFAASDGTIEIDVGAAAGGTSTVARRTWVPVDAPLQPVAILMSALISGAVAIVWLVLAALAVSTALGIRREGRIVHERLPPPTGMSGPG